ncbi:hypothetical protein [Enterococcus sp. SMC-9]|uniref:hypothetical protein n=1 Tax=Enterococcus sp. SMC-9 TaxID=2862343 RepID=UPI001E6343F3|nr:hypothetical protein [Enterococcus sp. SMC-9]MCD1023906.1 hypothetical protein [Enterococcus sp. SMC-9]
MKKIILLGALLLTLTACASKTPAANSEEDKSTAQTNATTTTTDKNSETKTKSSESTKNTTKSSSSEKKADALAKLKKENPKTLLPTNIPRDENRALNIAMDKQKDSLAVLYYIMDTPLVLNDQSLNQQTPFARYKMEQFASKDAAKKAVNYQFDDGGQKVDLGHDITAYSQGAAGSTYLNWKEGNWSIVLRASNVNGQDGTALAKEVVNYLEKAMLPAPKSVGQITIDMAQNGYESNQVVWQVDKTVYTVTHEDTIPALEMAVSMNK